MTTGIIHHCNQCNSDWQQRGPTKPLECPRCKRYDWAEPKKGNGQPRHNGFEPPGATGEVRV